MDKEKFIQRIEEMLYHVCGCNYTEARIILEECLTRNYKKMEPCQLITNELVIL